MLEDIRDNSLLSEDERRAFLAIPGLKKLQDRGPGGYDDFARDEILELIYRSGSDLVLLPYQDLVGARERVNVPGTVNDENWSYRVPMLLSALLADRTAAERLAALARKTGRLREAGA